MDMKLFSLQCAIFYRSIFLDYGNYGQLIQKIFSAKEDKVENPKDINIIPDDFYFMNFDGGNGYRVSISKMRTDIFYYEERDEYSYDEVVDDFFKNILLLINKVFKSDNICSRIGIINTSMIFLDNPVKYINDNFLKNKFEGLPLQLSISYNMRDIIKEISINRLFSIQEQVYTKKQSGENFNVAEVKLDINTNGVREKLNLNFLEKFINRYKITMKSGALYDQANGK